MRAVPSPLEIWSPSEATDEENLTRARRVIVVASPVIRVAQADIQVVRFAAVQIEHAVLHPLQDRRAASWRRCTTLQDR